MTRKQKRTPRKKSHGVLMGMRSGVQKVAGSVTGVGGADVKDEAAPRTTKSKVWGVISNVLSGALVVVAGAVLLHRCGILKF